MEAIAYTTTMPLDVSQRLDDPEGGGREEESDGSEAVTDRVPIAQGFS